MSDGLGYRRAPSISGGGRAPAAPGPLRWPRQPNRKSTSHAFLLDADDDLAQELDPRTRLAARQIVTARVLDADAGECDPAPWFDAVLDGPGLLILDGLVALETRVGDRTASELLGTGDLVQPPTGRTDDLLERIDGWRVLCPTRFALLDAEFADRVRPCPQIVQALLRRAGRRIADVDALRAITCQPRLEMRLVLLLWHLAARWGRVEPAGIRLSLPLTHRLLGHLVAAERPSVSHALARLARSGLVNGPADDLHLCGSLEHHLEALTERVSAPSSQEPTHSAPNGRRAGGKVA
ncbi:MAG: helix-turn-helix domain-containing protein [Actinomycetota bacterium]|nr:helix-turn-helix domain-containing protein [Actinomycetota bacterium]